jgi:hypothetical protein
VLAVVLDPPEARPGDSIEARVFVADALGAVASPQAYWALCTVPKGVAENNAVDRSCWDERYEPLGGPAETFSLEVPDDACSVFGPEVDDAELRPPDPDGTGGYYLPIRVAIPELAAFAFVRLSCRLPNAPADVVAAFEESYTANLNPAIVALDVTDESGAPAGSTLRPGARLSVQLTTTAGARERYPVYVQAEGDLDSREETLRVAWFSNAAELDREASAVEGVSSTALATVDGTGPLTIWAVLRDDRGGSAVVAWSAMIEAP